jgi:hypothetical protein
MKAITSFEIPQKIKKEGHLEYLETDLLFYKDLSQIYGVWDQK